VLDLPVLVNTVGDMFINAVARNRGIGLYAVRNGFGEGRMVLAQDAVKAGMVDGVAKLDQTVARLLGRRTGQGLSPAADRSLRRRELELLQ
jgi:capsid assembly protease